VGTEPAAFDEEQTRFAAMKLTDPWLKLAAAYAANRLNDQASGYFTRALQKAQGYQARRPILELAARFDDVLSSLIKRQPDDPQLQLPLARRLAEHGEQRLGEQQPVKAQAELEKSRKIFTRLLAQSGHWTVLTPLEMKTESGARLELQKDGSVFVHQQSPAKNDTYSVVFQSEMKGIRGLRLEALSDSRLPKGGPGWSSSNGNFVLNELTLHAAPAGSPDQARAIPLRDASADFNQPGWDVRGAIDDVGSTGWAVEPEVGKDHAAVFELAEEVGDGKGSRLTVRLKQLYEEKDYKVDRFRLSITDDATALLATRVRLDLKDSESVDFYLALEKADAQQGKTSEAISSLTAALSLTKDRAGKARIITEAAPLAGALEELAERAADDALFQAELVRHFAERRNAPLADAARTKARLLFEQKLAQEPENSARAVELAEVLLPPIDAKPMMVPTSETEAVSWRFSTKQPPADWIGEAFDDSAWTTSPGAFGGNGSAPGLVLRSEWKTSDIWLRRKFEWKPDPAVQTLVSQVIHDDGFELFVNGQRILSRQDVNTGYTFYPVDANALGLLKPGTNTLAVHCRSTAGAHYIDVGLHGFSSSPRAVEERLTAMKIADPWARLAAAYHVIGDQPALERLVKDHPAAASGIGDLYAANQDWERALGEYNKAISPQCKDARIVVARAEAHEKLEHWELAAADWGNADLHAVDKRERYGDPSFPALERRARVHGRLQQFDKQVLDYAELLKPERLGNNPWIFVGRAEAYGGLRQWDKVRSDVEQAIKVAPEAERRTFYFVRARLFFAAQGQMITNDNRPRLLELAGRTDAYWRPRLTAAIQYRSGNYDKAAEFFDANDPGPQFLFLAAMTYYKRGNQDRAKKLLDEGNSWVREQREKGPGAGGPGPYSWSESAVVVPLQYEASESIHGPGFRPNKLAERAVGDAPFQAALARHFAARGNAPAADAARAKARALLAEKLALEPENAALAADLLSAYQSAGRTREAIPLLAIASAANPKDTVLSLKVAALQAWFGDEKELAATRQRILAFAKDTKEATTADRAVNACSILPSTDKAELAAALALARSAVKLGNGVEWWNLLAVGMAEYRSGNDAAAEQALLAAAEAVKNTPADAPYLTGISSFFRAMSLFRQGRRDEARKLAIADAEKMKPLPADEQNPLAGNESENGLILWLAYKEAKAMIQFDAAPAAAVQTEAK
jgi:hypothetical protein